MAKQPPKGKQPSPDDKHKQPKPPNSEVDLDLPALEAAQTGEPSEVSQHVNWGDILPPGSSTKSDADLLMEDLQEIEPGAEGVPLARPVRGGRPPAQPVPPPAGPDEEDALVADMEAVRRLLDADNPDAPAPPAS